MENNIDKEKIFTVEDGVIIKYYDFNLYPLYIVEPHHQLFLVPTNDINQSCYIVRKNDGANGVRHEEFAQKLVNSRFFQESEFEEYKRSNGTSSQWFVEKQNYNLGEELQYLIDRKGFILFSPPAKDSKFFGHLVREFIPEDKSLLTKTQINNLLFLLERDDRINIDQHLLDELYNLVVDKVK